MGAVLIVSVESVLVQGGRSGWRETRFKIYFEGKTKKICCWIGHGLGEEEKNHVETEIHREKTAKRQQRQRLE